MVLTCVQIDENIVRSRAALYSRLLNGGLNEGVTRDECVAGPESLQWGHLEMISAVVLSPIPDDKPGSRFRQKRGGQPGEIEVVDTIGKSSFMFTVNC